MILTGHATPQEIETMRRQGWNIRRVEDDPEDDQQIVHIRVPERLSDVTKKWYSAEIQKMRFEEQQLLDTERRKVIEEVWEGYDFHENGDIPEESVVEDCDGWEHVSPGNEYWRTFYYTPMVVASGDPSIKGTFMVRFKENTAEVEEAFVSQ